MLISGIRPCLYNTKPSPPTRYDVHRYFIGGEHSSGSSSSVVQPKEPGLRWALPPAGWTALSVDGSLCAHDETAGAGMVLRDAAGAIIFSSCRELRSCTSPLEAELEACREGIQLALQWTTSRWTAWRPHSSSKTRV